MHGVFPRACVSYVVGRGGTTGDRVVAGSHWFRLETSAISSTPLWQCISEEIIQSVGTFCMVSMSGEVKYPTHGVNV